MRAFSPKSNGRAEEVVKRLAEGLKRFVTPEIDDINVEDILPLIELSLRTTCSKNMQVTPFEIVHGFQAPLPSPLATEELHFSNSFKYGCRKLSGLVEKRNKIIAQRSVPKLRRIKSRDEKVL